MNIYLSYATEDFEYVAAFQRHLLPLKAVYSIEDFARVNILAGTDFDETAARNLEKADIIVIFISADYLADDRLYEKELMPSLKRHETNTLKLFPFVIKPCLWEKSPVAPLVLFQGETYMIKGPRDWETDRMFKQIIKQLILVIENEFPSADATADERISDASIDLSFSAIVDVVYDNLKNTLFRKRDYRRSLHLHLTEVHNWSKDVSVPGLASDKTTNNYIQLNYFLTARRKQFVEEPSKPIELFDLLRHTRHLVLLGDPGAGKSTSMKYICQNLLERKGQLDIDFPMIIRFRDIVYSKVEGEQDILRLNEDALFRAIFSILGIRTDLEIRRLENKHILQNIVLTALEPLQCLLILDGFDELHPFLRDGVLTEIRTLLLKLERSRVIITSRSSDFPYQIDNAKVYEIDFLSLEQIKACAKQWIGEENDYNEFIRQILITPYLDSTMRPLTLANLCRIFNRRGEIPEKPKSVYKMVVNLLVQSWDEERGVKRPSAYNRFDAERKLEFLSRLAYHLTKNTLASRFTKQTVRVAYLDICEDFNLPKNEANEVITELESHNGVFIQSGHDQYEFSHKSIQEYLAADFIVRGRLDDDWGFLCNIPYELALAVSISSTPNLDLEYILQHICTPARAPKSVDSTVVKFMDSFLRRLLLEKPDFTKSTRLGLAVIFLYNHFRQYENVVYLIEQLFQIKAIAAGVAELSKEYALSPVDFQRVFQQTKAEHITVNLDLIVEIIPDSNPYNRRDHTSSFFYGPYMCKIRYLESWPSVATLVDRLKKMSSSLSSWSNQ